MNELSTTFVAAGVPPAVEPGVPPGGLKCQLGRPRGKIAGTGRRDTALHGRRDARRYRAASSSLQDGRISGLLWPWNSAESVRYAVVGPQVQAGFEGAAEIELSSADVRDWSSI